MGAHTAGRLEERPREGWAEGGIVGDQDCDGITRVDYSTTHNNFGDYVDKPLVHPSVSQDFGRMKTGSLLGWNFCVPFVTRSSGNVVPRNGAILLDGGCKGGFH